MKRLGILLLVIAVVAAVIIMLALRHKEMSAAAGVATLLPADTALLIHVPDLEANRDRWQRTDVYHLYHEAAVQDFLRKPRAQLPKGDALSAAWQDAATLRIRDAFVATNTFDALRFSAGFEFRCGEKEARNIIERWRAQWVAKGAQRSSATYGKHAIDVLSARQLTIASVLDDHRFFAATDIDDLKALLDRADRRAGQPLSGTADFRAAMKQMPADYAMLLYLQPKALAQKLVALRAQSGRPLPAGQQTLIERMRSFAHAMTFDGGKLRDVDFVAMPRLLDTKLTRDTLAAASSDTLLYLAAITSIRESLAGPSPTGTSILTKAGVTREDWGAAVGDEMSLQADWPATSRMPGVVTTLSVRDAARASKVASALAASAGWESSRRDGRQFFAAPASGLAVMRLVAALSDKRLAIGTDASGVERAVASAPKANSLESTAAFRDSARLVPEGQQLFAWLDLAAFYSRLDTTLRPLLQISAAFMPEAQVDVSKLPPAEVVTKHLGPVVTSQTYVDGGYRSESVGPITLGQAVVLGVAGYAGSMVYQKHGDVSTMWKRNSAPVASPSATTP